MVSQGSHRLEARLSEGNGLGLPAGQVVGKVVDVVDSPAQSLLKIRLVEPVVTGQDSKGEDVIEKTALVRSWKRWCPKSIWTSSI